MLVRVWGCRGHIFPLEKQVDHYCVLQLINCVCVCDVQDYNDEIRQAQLQELTYLNGGSEDAKVPAARGKSSTRGRGTPAPGPHRYDSGPLYCNHI